MLQRTKIAFMSALLIVGFLSQNTFATQQERDLLVYEGARHKTYPLPTLAECLPDVKLPEFRMISTANYKGYRATWAVIDNQFYLIGIEGKVKSNQGRRMLSSRELFPKVKFPHKVTSFTGKIEIKGRAVDYVIKGNVITYTDKIVIEFKNGKVIDVIHTTHDEIREQRTPQ